MNARCYECQRPLADDEDVCPLHPGAGVLQELPFFDLSSDADVEALLAVDDDPPC